MASSKAKAAGQTPEEKRQLPGKEQSLFRQIVRFYETKQYKKGLKCAEQILKKFPEHGETLSMKGLTLNCLDRKEEAYDYVKRGLRMDLRSHVCWHVFGLLYRSDHNYKEAIKCYLNALRLEKENLQILRDLSLLQIQMRDLPGFVNTRRQLLTLRPAQRTNWIAFAVAHHLVKNHDMCLQVIQAYEKTTAKDKDAAGGKDAGEGDKGKAGGGEEEQFQTSEMVLYRARVMEEGGRLEEAIDLIREKDDDILDKLGAKEALGRMFLASGRNQEAEELYRGLIDKNPENTRYHDGLFRSLGLPALVKGAASSQLPKDARQKMATEYDALRHKHPKCVAFVRRVIDLHHCEDDGEGRAFVSAVDAYARPWLKKGVPSLFQSLKDLYEKRRNAELIEGLFEGYESSLRKSGTLGEGDSAEEMAPDVLVWVLAFLAQHYDRVGNIAKALEKCDAAIAHTPTVIELYTIKAKVMKHAGNLSSAALLSDHARQLDLADRYLNCHTVKYKLRAGDIDEANSLAVLFTKDNLPGNSKDDEKKKKEKPDPLQSLKNLHEMQCIWYEHELGSAHLRLAEKSDGNFESVGRALHKYRYILQHFDDMHEDQFDFHSYCLRKMTLRSYLDMLKFEDQIYAHPFYSKGAWGALRCYLRLHDDPPAKRREREAQEEEERVAKMAPNERKKYRAKQRKLQKQKEQAAAAAGDHAQDGANNSSGGQKPKDSRPFLVKEEEDAEKLLYTENPLEEASSLLKKLQEYQQDDPKLETQLLAFEWAMRSGKLLMALQAVRRALKIDGDSPGAHLCFVRLVLKSRGGCLEGTNKVVAGVMTSYIEKMLGGRALEAYAESYVAKAGSKSMLHALAGAEARGLASSLEGSALEDLLSSGVVGGDWFTEAHLAARTTTHTSCIEVHGRLAGVGSLGERWAEICARHFPYSSHFGGEKARALQGDPKSILGVQSALENLAIQ